VEFKQKGHAQQAMAAGKPNLTGIPLQMKQSFERSSGLSFDDVRVHYHSALPSRLGALAYTRGPHVYVAPGQERHLGHELGHVVQQKQGRVRATSELGGVKLNTSPGLEQEADMLCRQALQGVSQVVQRRQAPASEVVQMMRYQNIDQMWANICGNPRDAAEVREIIQGDPVLAELYQDAAAQVPACEFEGGNDSIQITALETIQDNDPKYKVEYTNYPDAEPNAHFERRYFIGALLHELAHAAVDQQYRHEVPEGSQDIDDTFVNMNFLDPHATPDAHDDSFMRQGNLLRENINRLGAIAEREKSRLQGADRDVYHYLFGNGRGHTNRLDYMGIDPFNHYDVVLGEMMYHLRTAGLTGTDTYRFIQRMLREANDRRHQRSQSGNETPYLLSEKSVWSPSTWFQQY